MVEKSAKIPAWKTATDVLLVFITLFRLIIGYTVDVGMLFKYPLALKDCPAACASAMCELNCNLRATMHLDMEPYLVSGVDPAAVALGLPVRLLAGFYWIVVAHFLIVLVYALWTRKEWVRVPALAMAAVLFCMMATFMLDGILGQPPSTAPGKLALFNGLDIVTPFLILARVASSPLFGPSRERAQPAG